METPIKEYLQVQRTHRKSGNLVRIKSAEGTRSYEELTLDVRGEKVHYIPYDAFLELLRHYKNKEPVVEVMVFLPEDF